MILAVFFFVACNFASAKKGVNTDKIWGKDEAMGKEMHGSPEWQTLQQPAKFPEMINPFRNPLAAMVLIFLVPLVCMPLAIRAKTLNTECKSTLLNCMRVPMCIFGTIPAICCG